MLILFCIVRHRNGTGCMSFTFPGAPVIVFVLGRGKCAFLGRGKCAFLERGKCAVCK